MTRRSTPPTPLRASPKVLDVWAETVARAQRSTYPTLLVEPWLIVAINQELRLLRASNEALRQMRTREATA